MKSGFQSRSMQPSERRKPNPFLDDDMISRVSKTFVLLILIVAFLIGPNRVVMSVSGYPKFQLAAAYAQSGSGSDGNGGDDDEDDDSEDGGGSDDEDDDDGDDENDDGDDDDDSEDDEDDDGEDDEGEEEDAGSGSSGSGSGKSTSGQNGTESGGSYQPGRAIVRIEVSSSGVKIRYADGGREEIENGQYELRDPSGRRVERRTAKGSDIARLKAVSTRVSIRSVTRRDARQDDVRSVGSSSNSIRATYSNGWIEDISGGTYRLIDPYERAVATRPATRADRARLQKLASGR